MAKRGKVPGKRVMRASSELFQVLFLSFFNFLLIFREKGMEVERKRSICCSTYLFIG